MEDICCFSVIEFMESLWFHRVVLCSAKPVPKTLTQPSLSITESLLYPSSTHLSLPTPPDDEISPPTSPFPEDGTTSSSASAPLTLLDYSKKLGDDNNEVEKRERPARLNPITGRVRSHSFSASTEKRPKRIRHTARTSRRLQKSMSCRSSEELELEEVKGFMDLGFVFNKEHLTPRMMSVVPGLQRLGLFRKTINNTSPMDCGSVTEGDDNKPRKEEEEEKEGAIRPYLSEAWLITRPDSPLLNLRLPKVSTASDMKKHLRFWARTVATAIYRES
ncbi:hypothetical protein K2173_019416 [Erythroxylum novogranatense]|uniref:Uncharacterized protein n=1 Tax=Erythroxylum novogranatense TaxID=1862640 RepID=A0AAV8UEJ9_9ROSI|nr:hypothetical protein K2173_019416 [Erythroxylum novogranatense]